MVEWDTLFCHSPLICNQESSQLGKDGSTKQTRMWEFHTSVHLKVGGRKHIGKAKSRKSKNGAYDPNPCCNSWTYSSPREPNSYRKAAHTTLASWQKQYSSIFSVQFISVQSLSCIWIFVTPWTTARQASLSINNSRSLPKLMSIESMMPSNHLILCGPLLLLPSVFPNIRVFSNEPVLYIRWPKYWSFSFNVSPSNEYPGLISFRMDWLDLLAVLGTLKSLIQHHSSKASIFQCSAFLTVQLSHPYMTTGKTIVLTRRTFVNKVMSLFFNMLSCIGINQLKINFKNAKKRNNLHLN